MTKPVVIFLHMFKTGGTSITTRIVSVNYTAENHAIFNTSLDNPRHPSQMPDAKFITGHDLFGIHKQLKEKPYAYMTFFRDPVERIVSMYYNMREPKLQHLSKGKIFIQHTLSEVLNNSCLATLEDHFWIRDQIDNYYVRQLAGVNKQNLMMVTNEHLKEAKSNIEKHFKFVGFTEDIDTSWNQLSEKFKWKLNGKEWPHQNQTIGKPLKIDTNVTQNLQGMNYLDYCLLDWIKNNQNRINK